MKLNSLYTSFFPGLFSYLVFIFFYPTNISSQEFDTVAVYKNATSVDLDTSDYIANDLNFNLIIAANNGFESEVMRLLKEGSNPNARTYEGVTPLMYAVQLENLKICKILLLNGADPDLKDYIHGTPALMAAVNVENLEISELLIRKGANPDIQNKKGATPLIQAAAFNLLDIADMLIYYNADVNLSDHSGNTPLIAASFNGNSEMVDLLIENKAVLERKDSKGYTALHCAAQNGFTDIVETLVSKGSDIELKNSLGYSPLAISILNKQIPVSRSLINRGADVNSNISRAMKPLNIALDKKNDTLIAILSEKGAKQSYFPAFNFGSVNFDISLSAEDVMLGGGFGIHDSKYGLSLGLGYVTRLFAKEILESAENNIYYQYREKRSYFYFRALEKIRFYNNNNVSLGLGLGGQTLFTYGNYSGTTQKPENRFIVSPQAATYLRVYKVVFSIRYEYIDFDIIDISPHRINISFQFLISGKHIKQSPKKNLWYQ